MVTVVLLRWVFQRSGYAVALGHIVIDQIGGFEDLARSRLYQLKARDWIGPLPLAQLLNDVFDSLILSFVLSREFTLGMWTIVFSAGSRILRMSSA